MKRTIDLQYSSLDNGPIHRIQFAAYQAGRWAANQTLTVLLLAAIMLSVLLLSACSPPVQVTPVSTPKVTISADGQQLALDVKPGMTVQNALQEAGVSLDTLDRVDPPSYTLLSGGELVVVTRVREVFTAKETIIPFERQTVHNESLPEGKTLLVQQGVNGVEQSTFRQVFENDREVSNSIFKTEILTQPVPEVMMIGVQKPFTPVPIPKRLAYLSAGNAWVMENSTGSRRPVVTTGDLDGRIFVMSPRGEWLLFTRGAQEDEEDEGQRINSLWAVDLTEETPQPINLKVDNVIHFAGWVPGKGLTVIYSTVEPRDTAPGWQANNDLQTLNFSTTGAIGKVETILETNMGGLYGWWGSDFVWSPDGSMLAYARPDEVGIVNMETRAQTPLATLLPFQTGSSWAWVPGLGWSPNNDLLYLVTHAPKAGLENAEESPLFDLSGLPVNKQALSSSGPVIPVVPQAGMFAYPVPGPKELENGFRVAYLRAIFPEQSDSKRYRLVVMDRDGSNGVSLFPPEDRQGLDPQRVVWSPEKFSNGNSWIAVNYQGNLWLVDSVSGEAQQITGDGLISRIDWK